MSPAWGIRWTTLDTKKKAKKLQSFTCAEPPPTGHNGRKLPPSTPWENEAQTIIRSCGNKLTQSEIVVAGEINGTVVAAARVDITPLTTEDSRPAARLFIAGLGVALTLRGQGGGVANALMTQLIETGCVAAEQKFGATFLLVQGKVHTSNLPSQRLFERLEFEPHGVPSGDYQLWQRLFEI